MGATVGIGRGRNTADIFVQTWQKPFGDRVGKIMGSLATRRDAGTLSYDEAVAGQTDLESAIAEFEKDSQLFEGLGGSQRKVVEQARSFFTPIIADWRKEFTETLSRLPKPEPKPELPKPGEEAPTASTILGGVAAQKKRPTKDYGTRRTILGGTYGEGRQAKKTLLGY